jgi:hypothetical protein
METILWIAAGALILILFVMYRINRHRVLVYQAFHRALASAISGIDITKKEKPDQFPSLEFDPGEITAELEKLLGDNFFPTYQKHLPQLTYERAFPCLYFLYCLSTARQVVDWILDPKETVSKAEDIAAYVNHFLKIAWEGYRNSVGAKLPAIDMRDQFIEPLLARLKSVLLSQGKHAIVVSNDNGVQFVTYIDTNSAKIGRGTENAIHLDNLDVAFHHATITFGKGQIYIESAGTGTNVFVNGILMSDQLVNPNDVIGIGPFKLKVLA